MYTKEKFDLANIEEFGAVLFIVSLLVSVFLYEERKKELVNMPTFFSKQTDNSINVVRNLLIIIITLIFLYSNYNGYKIAQLENENPHPAILQVWASILSIIAAVLVFNAIVESVEDNEEDISLENPSI